MARNIQVLILAEDLRQANFAKHFLQARNVSPGTIRILPLPAGRGSGYDYVIREYPQQLKGMRRLGASAGLIVMIDADDGTVERRQTQLSDALQQAQLTPPNASECVRVLVPKRNVDTWVFHLLGNSVNEDDDYKRQVGDRDILPAAKTFADGCPDRLRPDCPQSLKQGCENLNSFRQCIRV